MTEISTEVKPEFSPQLIVSEIAKWYPEVVEILMEYGLHCVGCMASGFETLEEGSLGHGMPEAEFANMIADCKDRIAEVAAKEQPKKEEA